MVSYYIRSMMNHQVVWSAQPKDQLTKIHKEIADNSSDNISYWNSLYGIIILIACILYTSFLTLIPRHNSILYPDYWYETIFLFGAVSIRNSALLIIELYIFTNAKTLVSVSLVFISFLGIWLLFSIPYCVCYLIWSHYYDYYHPMPFIGAICSTFYEFMMLTKSNKILHYIPSLDNSTNHARKCFANNCSNPPIKS